ncbi:unnamed protein product [Peronospora farinosa]|uniref:RxLR effector protein n=1 Tax=Peronospora farinosa TaxID=134698 RepID=A0ABN8CAV3_9STRA|nr:unnamed protein product [Peronospora farinosa]
MRLSLFLLLVTLTCIACDSIVASSKDLIQVKTVDTNSQRERTDGRGRKLREGVVETDIDDLEERMRIGEGELFEKVIETLEKFEGGAETNADVMAKKIGALEKRTKSARLKQGVTEENELIGSSQPKRDANAAIHASEGEINAVNLAQGGASDTTHLGNEHEDGAGKEITVFRQKSYKEPRKYGFKSALKMAAKMLYTRIRDKLKPRRYKRWHSTKY